MKEQVLGDEFAPIESGQGVRRNNGKTNKASVDDSTYQVNNRNHILELKITGKVIPLLVL